MMMYSDCDDGDFQMESWWQLRWWRWRFCDCEVVPWRIGKTRQMWTPTWRPPTTAAQQLWFLNIFKNILLRQFWFLFIFMGRSCSPQLYFLDIFVTLPLLDNRNHLIFSSGDLIGNDFDFLIFFKDGSDGNGIVTAAMVLVMMFVFVVTILGIGSGRLACWQGAIQMNNNKTLSFCKYTPQRYI